MREVFSCLQMDFRRAFWSPRFAFAVIGTAIALYSTVFQEILPGMSCSLYYYNMSLGGIAPLIMVAVPYSMSFCSDWRNRFIRPCIIRSNPAGYAFSKIFTCGISTTAAIALGHILFLLALLTKYPFLDPGSSWSNYGGYGYFDNVIIAGHPILFIMIKIFLAALLGSMLATIALCISTKIPNIFVVITSPILAYYAIMNTCVILRFPVWINLNALYHAGLQYAVKGTTTGQTLLYVFGITVVICTLLGVVFYRNVKEKLENG